MIDVLLRPPGDIFSVGSFSRQGTAGPAGMSFSDWRKLTGEVPPFQFHFTSVISYAIAFRDFIIPQFIRIYVYSVIGLSFNSFPASLPSDIWAPATPTGTL